MTFTFPTSVKKFKQEIYLVNIDAGLILDTSEIFCVHGYDFADRLLEGVKFYAKISEDRKQLEVFDSSGNYYLESLNAKKWSKLAAELIAHGVDGGEEMISLKSDPEVYVELYTHEALYENEIVEQSQINDAQSKAKIQQNKAKPNKKRSS